MANAKSAIKATTKAPSTTTSEPGEEGPQDYDDWLWLTLKQPFYLYLYLFWVMKSEQSLASYISKSAI